MDILNVATFVIVTVFVIVLHSHFRFCSCERPQRAQRAQRAQRWIRHTSSEKGNVLILSSGGLRQILLLAGALDTMEFKEVIRTCDIIEGTSAGALIGLILAAMRPDDEKVNGALISDMVPNTSCFLSDLCKLMCNKDVIDFQLLYDALNTALIKVQPGISDYPYEVQIYRTLVIGRIEHLADGENNYEEKVINRGRYSVKDVIRAAVGSASIAGLTSSGSYSDGAQVHPFPIKEYQHTGRKFVFCPYPYGEMKSPHVDTHLCCFSHIRLLISSVCYGAIMAHVYEDIKRIATNRWRVHDDTGRLYITGVQRDVLVCPQLYIAPTVLHSASGIEQKALYDEGVNMGIVLARAM